MAYCASPVVIAIEDAYSQEMKTYRLFSMDTKQDGTCSYGVVFTSAEYKKIMDIVNAPPSKEVPEMNIEAWIAYLLAAFFVGFFLRKTIKKFAFFASGSHSEG